jgi:hypothetical protein
VRRILTGERVVWFILAALYVAPLWAFTYVPSADGPSHLANAVIIKDYNDPAAERIREYYVVSGRPSPNLLYHLALVGLLYVFPPLIAEKVLLTLYVVLFAAAFRYLVIAVSGRPGPAALLVFPFILSFSFSLGFFGWLISLVVATFGVGYYWRRRNRLSIRSAVALNAIGVVAYFAHLLGWTIFVGSVAALAVAGGLWRWAAKMREGVGVRPALRALWSRAVAAACISPAAALGIWYIAAYPAEYPVTHTSFPGLVRNMLRLEWLISFNVWQRAAAYTIAAAFGVLVIFVLSYKIYVSVICRSARAPGAWVPKDAIWFAVLAFAVFYLVCPWGGPAGGSYVSPRLALLPFLVIAVWLSTVPGPLTRRALYVVAPVLAAFHLFGLTLGYVKANGDIAEFNSGRPYVTEGSTILPIQFIYATGVNEKADYMCNAASYYILDNYAVNLLNYEADFEYFAVNWRHGAPIGEYLAESRGTPIFDPAKVIANADYLVCWKVNPFCAGMRPLVKRYGLVYSTAHLMVFRRRDA